MKARALFLVLVAFAVCASAQEIRSYKKSELYPGQICADDGTPNWEGLMVGDCPQGFNGIRNFAKRNGLLPQSNTGTTARAASALRTGRKLHQTPSAGYQLQNTWPFCNACNNGNKCFEFKPGVAKCIVPVSPTQEFLKDGEKCLDFSNGNKKWKPAEVNPKLFGQTCQWPLSSCNWDAKSNNGVYRCQRIRATATSDPLVKCYRAAGSRWWGGSDQWYAWHNGKFTPCGGPNPDYKPCSNFPACAAAAPWAWAE